MDPNYQSSHELLGLHNQNKLYKHQINTHPNIKLHTHISTKIEALDIIGWKIIK